MTQSLKMTFRITAFKGKEITSYTRILSQLRVREFYEFPYLYVGTVEEDAGFTNGYSLSDQGMLVVAFKDGQVAGLYSGMPMQVPTSFLEQWSQTLTRKGIDTANCYYSGELIIQPEFRQNHLGSALMQRFIQEVKQMGFKQMMGVTSIREADHPLKPKNYFDTDKVWQKRGFQKMSFELSSAYPTRQPDQSIQETENKLACWIYTI